MEDSCVMAEAEMLNRPPVCFADQIPSVKPPFFLESDGITLEVVKRAEKSDAWILRLVERLGRTSAGVLCTTLDNDPEIAETDLMEWNPGEKSRFCDGKLPVTLKPFEIRTLQIVPESGK
ncbi:MAG: hypothetical protein J6R85_00135 [Lentisphaeria bacterium]|nr:hypothetical protein [Lentisphaeria bacterium]